MSDNSSIEWTDHTFNPWWGCSRVSPECQRCYAETFAHRLGLKVWGDQAERRHFGGAHWREPLKWNARAEKAGQRKRVFCASMADVFEDREEFGSGTSGPRAHLFALIERTPALDWMLLTKRPENMCRMAPSSWANGWPGNAWAGTTIGIQSSVDRLVPLLSVPAAIRFLSMEPLLGPVLLDLTGISLVIVGGESGPGARRCDLAWIRGIVEQCKVAGVPVFVKQLGARAAAGGVDVHWAFKSRKGGDMNEWPPDLRVREFPEVTR